MPECWVDVVFRSRRPLKKKPCKGKPLGLTMAAECMMVTVLACGGGKVCVCVCVCVCVFVCLCVCVFGAFSPSEYCPARDRKRRRRLRRRIRRRRRLRRKQGLHWRLELRGQRRL